MKKKITLATSVLLFSAALNAADTNELEMLKQQVKELQETTQTLIDETSDLKTGFNYTTVDTKKSHSGLGSAASKVYYSKSPLSIGGYGEMYYANSGSQGSVVDVYRFVPYIGYKFSDNIILNTEIEFEHGGVNVADGTGAEVLVEFMYLDFLQNKNLNVRLGNMLVPMGLINERHEPTLFTTVQRPSTAKYLIPSTWSESGVMAYGEIAEGWNYKLALLTALKPADNGAKWIRGGRGGSFENKNPNGAVVARVDYSGLTGLNTGVSVYKDNQLTMSDLHLDYKKSGARIYGVYTQTTRSDANATQVKKAQGGFVNVSYDILTLTNSEKSLPLFVQYESVDAQAEFGDGSSADKTTTLTVGVNYYPHPQVVLKADYADATLQSSPTTSTQTLSLSMGFIF